DLSGSAYVTGATLSSDFPTTNGAFDSTSAGGVFVTKLDAAGTGLVYSTYLGNGGDQGYAIAVDSSANAYVTGQTIFTNFPTTSGASQSTFGGYYDAFVSKLNAAGSALVYSTYLCATHFHTCYSTALPSFVYSSLRISDTEENYPTPLPLIPSPTPTAPDKPSSPTFPPPAGPLRVPLAATM